MERIDWKKLKTEYISTDISIREIAEKYSVSVSTVKARSSKEGWVEARKKFRANVDTKTIQKVEDASARARARTILKAQRTAAKLNTVLNKIAGKTDQFYMHLITRAVGDGITETTCEQFEKPDTKALRDCTAALKDLTGCIKELYGDMGATQETEENYTGVVELPPPIEDPEEPEDEA